MLILFYVYIIKLNINHPSSTNSKLNLILYYVSEMID